LSRTKSLNGNCPVCNDPVYSAHPETKMHLACVPMYLKGYRWEGLMAFKKAPIANDNIFKATKYSDDLLAKLGPVVPPQRGFEDPRNNARLNIARNEGRLPGMSPVRTGVFDIETTGLNAGFGVVLCAVVRLYGPDETFVLRADDYPEWKEGRRANDKALVADILNVLSEADILVAHNGVKFDMPFLRTRAIIHGLPAVNFQKIIDPVLLARQTFRFPGNSLQSISGVIGTEAAKTPLRPEVWQRATMNGDPDAMNEIVEHCIADVEVLEEVCLKIRGYIRKIDSSGSFRG
jgi:hypothetical protein